MMGKLLVFVGIFCSLSFVYCGSVLEAFTKHELNDVIEDFPDSVLGITFPSSVVVNLGNELTVVSVKDQPTVVFSDAKPDTYYTLAMVDPDAPSKTSPTLRNWNHWIVGNIKGNDFSGADTVVAFIGSGPPPKTDFHRYVFYYFEQPGLIDFSRTPHLDAKSGDGRPSFSLKEFAFQYKLGKPVAGNFYLAKNAEGDVHQKDTL